MARPRLQSVSPATLKRLLWLWGRMGTHNRVILNELGSPKNFTSLQGQSESKRDERERPKLPSPHFTSLSAAAGWDWHGNSSLCSWAETRTLFKRLKHGCLVCPIPRVFKKSRCIRPNGTKLRTKMLAIYYLLLPKKEQKMKPTALLSSLHEPCLDICLRQAKGQTCSLCESARPYRWRSPPWVDTKSPPRPPDICLSETSGKSRNFLSSHCPVWMRWQTLMAEPREIGGTWVLRII